ncbi:MAG: glycosyltransferase family 2 protein [Candidatus Saccharibacteria bacterium]|nr:glycosyltransferase family 2 protein [Candidatus Saccharibacteria bacterium]
MTDIEIPLGKRTRQYRFFEMVPAIISYGLLLLLVVLSIFNPFLAAMYLLAVILTLFIKSVTIAARTIQGYGQLQSAQAVNWQKRLRDITIAENPKKALPEKIEKGFHSKQHLRNLQAIRENPDDFPKVDDVYHAVIVAAYNESLDTLGPTIESVSKTRFPNEKIIFLMAFEERGGPDMHETVQKLESRFGKDFYAFIPVKHPRDIPGEVAGKGANVTYAGKHLRKWLKTQPNIENDKIIITTLDSDNRPDKGYFSYVTYEYIVHPNRDNLSFQPIALFLNNIWDAPAPMRVVATGNSFFNIIISMRPHVLRNFASHSQPYKALNDMDFWSVRTIVEDGHQYWRSYFHFDGKYSVVPIYVPIYQDAVLASTYWQTLKAQFVQVRRWAYGASDVPYVAVRIFNKKRSVPFVSGFAHLLRLIDNHTTWASMSILVAVGGWVPLLINQESSRSIIVHELPEVISSIQRLAMIGIFITIFLTFKMLPPRPERYKRHRSVLMLLQWVLMPITAIAYGSLASFYSQTRLAIGKYMDKFDVTEKATK